MKRAYLWPVDSHLPLLLPRFVSYAISGPVPCAHAVLGQPYLPIYPPHLSPHPVPVLLGNVKWDKMSISVVLIKKCDEDDNGRSCWTSSDDMCGHYVTKLSRIFV